MLLYLDIVWKQIRANISLSNDTKFPYVTVKTNHYIHYDVQMLCVSYNIVIHKMMHNRLPLLLNLDGNIAPLLLFIS